MIKKLLWLVCFTTLMVIAGPACNKTDQNLWPEIRPYKSGYLKVSKLHEIFYQLGGNPAGKPVLVLHGGPGAGCDASYFRYFNPKKFHIILHDQRGCGQSKPFAELTENTTQDLVEDIEKLRQHLKLGQVMLFGGSWGSTLALAYAETYPNNVSSMVLRGIFTATRAEIDHFYHGGTANYFPEVHEKLTEFIDRPAEGNFPAQLLAKITNPDSATRDKYARAWARYEGKIAFLNLPDQRLERMLDEWGYYAFSLIENHYMANTCFLAEGQLFNNADKLINIPITLVNGRYDLICPPITAFKLHRKLPGSKLFIIESAGHSATEPGIQKKLVEAVQEFD